MASLDDVKFVIQKIVSIDGVGDNLCFFGGSIPYIYSGQDSHREHSDIDVLVDEKYIDVIRNLLQSSSKYDEKLDSKNLGLDEDYGLKTYINGVYVEFESMIIEDGIFIRRSFNPEKRVAGSEEIPFSQITDLISTLEIDGVKTYCQSMEMIKVGKEKYRREKDLKDIEFIDRCGIDEDKYERVKRAVEQSSSQVSTFEEIRNKMEM